MAVEPLDRERPHMTVFIHAGRHAHVPFDPSRDALNHDARLPQEPYGMHSVVAFDVERAHGLVGQLDRAMDALVAEPAPELVYGKVELLAPVGVLGVAEEVVLHGLAHRHEVGRSNMDCANGMFLVERLVGTYQPHRDVGHIGCETGRLSESGLPRISRQVLRAPYAYGYGTAPEAGFAEPLCNRFGKEPDEGLDVRLALHHK